MTDEVVRIENKFALEAHYKLSLVQQKVFYALVSKLNPHEESSFKEIVITVSELKEILASDAKAYKSLYSRLDDFIDKISRVIFRFPTDVEFDGEILRGAMPFFQHVIPKYTKHGEAAISFQFNDYLKSFLLHLSEYVQLDQLQVTKMKSVYSIRIYTFLKAIRAKRGQYEKVSSETYGVEQLRGLLGIKHKEYKRFYNFDQRVLRQAQREINENTDIRILEIEKIKARRAVTNLTFHFTEQKPPNKKQLKMELDEPKSEPPHKPKPRKKKEAKKPTPPKSRVIENIDDEVTRAQKLGFDLLDKMGVNQAFIIDNILQGVRGLGTEARGYEDLYIKILLGEFNRKSTEAGKPHQAGVFVNWWKRFLNDDEQKSRFREALIARKKSISEVERSARIEADEITSKEYEERKAAREKEKADTGFVSKRIAPEQVVEVLEKIERVKREPFELERVKVEFPEKYNEILEERSNEFFEELRKLQETSPDYSVSVEESSRTIKSRIEFYFKKWYDEGEKE